MNTSRKIGLIAGPLLFVLFYLNAGALINEQADLVVAVASWMIVWWITEAVSISVTALLPLLLFPILKVMEINAVGANYGSSIVFLFFGGFVMALALEKVNLHRRIALTIIHLTGTSPNRVILGFMLATALLSMWISNTATTVVMLPIASSVIALLITDEDGFTKKDKNFAISVMLGIAFSANSGGIATLIGTPPNSVMVGLLENEYNIQISFVRWMMFGVPLSALLIAISYVLMVYVIFPSKGLKFSATNNVIKSQLDEMGPLSGKEKQVLAIFGITVFLWIFRALINQLFPELKLSDTSISLFAAISLFAIPHRFKKGDFIIDWKDTSKLAWGILILFGGGLALAKGMSSTGIVDLVAQEIASSNLSVSITAILLIFLMLFMTELMSNVALVAVLAPVVVGIAIGLNIPILHLLIPVTIASSCAFMLPMATPPNAIVFASGYIKVSQMAKIGILLNLISVGLLTLVFQFVMPLLF